MPRAPYGDRGAAREALKEKLLSGLFPTGSRLPPLRVLCKDLGISLSTANLVIRDLHAGGLVEIRPRKGVFCKHQSTPHQTRKLGLKPAKTKAEKISDLLAASVASGDLKSGDQLPLRKVLRHQFGTSHATLKRALEIADRRRVVHRSGSHYFAGPARSFLPGAKQKVYVIPAWSSSLGIVIGQQGARANFLRPMEAELSQHNLTFVGRRGRYAVKRKGPAVPPQPDAAGYLFPCSDAIVLSVAGENQKLMEMELGRVNSLGIPVVLFNCAAIRFAFPGLSFRPYENIFPLGINNRQGGRKTGEYLATLGHRQIAFLSFDQGIWNPLRQEGVVRGLRHIGGQQCLVHPMGANINISHYYDFSDHQSPKLVKKISDFTRSVFNDHEFVVDHLARQAVGDVFGRVILDLHHRKMEPLFKEALKNPDITAWVCADSSVALAAARYLEFRGVKIPREISLLAIDDDEVLSDNGITGCDLQISKLAYLAAHCVLGDIPLQRDSIGIVKCPAKIVDRGSVARV